MARVRAWCLDQGFSARDGRDALVARLAGRPHDAHRALEYLRCVLAAAAVAIARIAPG